MKEELIKIVNDLENQIEKYKKNPNHISYSGVLLERALPKYYWLLGKKQAYECVLKMLEKEV